MDLSAVQNNKYVQTDMNEKATEQEQVPYYKQNKIKNQLN